jgi:hypothetical protein
LSAADLAGKRVLVAEDEFLVVMLFEEILDKLACGMVGPFVLVSGYGRGAVPPDRPHWTVCPKPFNADDLVNKLTDSLRARRSRHA